MNNMDTPFSLRIFVADGDPDGLLLERRMWISAICILHKQGYT